ncbi:MAG: hypothetical protein AC479_06280 [miscellaneous Crenarchaeota group-6 archaeon AD8-1]|nr:MAG: hypothetical protein AC479_06280 [miscellaneous Crenarchaeota group-6 archaeon AD8-1]
MDVGLTLVQAKTYLSLVSSNGLTIKDISKVSGISRTDLYRIMTELKELSLIEKIISNPSKYKAAPINQAMKKEIQNEPNKFILIPSKRTPINIEEAIDRANNTIDLVVSLLRFNRGFDVFFEKLERSWKKKVKWRIILEIPPDKTYSYSNVNICQRQATCEVRFLLSPISTATGIYDQKEVFIIENPKAGLSDSPALWTDNRSLISLAKDYFEFLWITSLKEPKYAKD